MALAEIATDVKAVTKEKKGVGPWRSALRRFLRNKSALAGLILIAFFVGAAVFAPYIAPYDPLIPDLKNRLAPPSAAHLLGTDYMGRDILSRIIYGARISLRVGLITVSIALVVGTLMGMLAGYYGRIWDTIIMRFTDIMLAFPSTLLAIAIMAILGPKLINAMIAIGVVQIPQFARIVRSSVLSVKEFEYVDAARALGLKNGPIIFKHLLPNSLAPIIVQATLSVATAIIETAGLSFLGLGAQPPTPEWGAMLADSRAYLRIAPWTVAFPGLAILIATMGMNLIGDGLRDALDPRMKE
ncbi:MAG: ABC transporter permease [Firmicutes bacterium]|nr:ABC transporter permease [Bacillota bacterium]